METTMAHSTVAFIKGRLVHHDVCDRVQPWFSQLSEVNSALLKQDEQGRPLISLAGLWLEAKDVDNYFSLLSSLHDATGLLKAELHESGTPYSSHSCIHKLSHNWTV